MMNSDTMFYASANSKNRATYNGKSILMENIGCDHVTVLGIASDMDMVKSGKNSPTKYSLGLCMTAHMMMKATMTRLCKPVARKSSAEF